MGGDEASKREFAEHTYPFYSSDLLFLKPMLTGLLTVYDHGLRASDRVGVIGIGGLGHLALQFGKAMGMEMVAFTSTDSKKEEAKGFGASEVIPTKGVKEFKDVKKLDHLIVTTSGLPDFALYAAPFSTIVRGDLPKADTSPFCNRRPRSSRLPSRWSRQASRTSPRSPS